MFTKLKDNAAIAIGSSLLQKYDTEELNAGKRLISIVAGIYILQKGIRGIKIRPLVGFEEIALGTILLYTAASGLNKKIIRKPLLPSDIRKNQIQGNDPNSADPAFV